MFGLPGVEVVVPLVDLLRRLLDTAGVVILVDRYQFLRQLVEQLHLLLVLV